MKIILIFSLAVFFNYELLAQNNQIVREGESENIKEITHQVFKYTNFVEGSIFLKDGTSYEAKLNYSRALGTVMAIDRIGKADTIKNPETIDKITIARDTFYFYNNNFLEKITHFSFANLYMKQTMVYVEKQSSTENTTPQVISNGSKLPYSFDGEKKSANDIDRNSVFKFMSEYFVADNSMNFYPATKKSFYDLFTTHEKELKTFLKKHSVNFTDIEQVERLLQYMNSL